MKRHHILTKTTTLSKNLLKLIEEKSLHLLINKSIPAELSMNRYHHSFIKQSSCINPLYCKYLTIRCYCIHLRILLLVLLPIFLCLSFLHTFCLIFIMYVSYSLLITSGTIFCIFHPFQELYCAPCD